jgi:hypothetical protein
MFRLDNDIALLLVGYISFFKREVRAMGQCIKFLLLTPKAICDDKLKLKQGQCPLSLMLIQNTCCHEIL